MQELKILKAETGEEIASRCYLANRFFSRLKGLLGKEYMSDGEGLLISPCSSVHTMGMKICIDVVYAILVMIAEFFFHIYLENFERVAP
jgi:uncharacterized membrane protein (UPF0127 family)